MIVGPLRDGFGAKIKEPSLSKLAKAVAFVARHLHCELQNF